MSFFYSFPSELVRLTLRDNSITLEYPRDRLYSTILTFYFATTCLFILASFAFKGYGVQLFVVHVDILVFLFLQVLLLQKGLSWAQCVLALAESQFAMTDTVRRDSMRRREATRTSNYENSALRRERPKPPPAANSDEPHSININMTKLNTALKNGSLFD